MKKHITPILSLLLCLTSGLLSAQKQTPSFWLNLMEDQKVTFYDVQKSFYADPENPFSQIKKAGEEEEQENGGWEQFKRYEYFASPRVYPSGNRALLASTSGEFQKYLNDRAQQRQGTPSIQSAAWSYFCPNGIPNGAGAGRVNCICADPSNSSNVWLGAPDGGAWKSSNLGGAWSTNSDMFTNLGVSDVAVAPGNNKIIFVATGDRDGFFSGSSQIYTYGIMRSTDGGLTWANVYSTAVTTAGMMSRILIDPSNIETIYASGTFGILKSIDGGTTWTITKSAFEPIWSMEFKPGNSNTIYASGKNFFVSNDAGATWTTISSGLAPKTFRMSIAVTPANPSYVYVLSADQKGMSINGVYRSTDSGNTFTKRKDGTVAPNLMGFSSSGSDAGAGQSFYTNTIAASPTNAEEVMVGGVNIWKSTDGGTTWGTKAITNWSTYHGAANYVHADIHQILYINGTTVLVGCDGGIFKSTNDGTSWGDICSNLQISQLYGMGMSTSKPAYVISGWQDNGTNLMTSTTAWASALSGDGMKCFVDYSNDNNMWGEQYNASFNGTTNGGASWNYLGSPSTTEATAWATPWKQDPGHAGTILAGMTNMYNSTDGGNNWNQLGTQPDVGNYVNEFAVAPSNSQVIYVVKNSGVFKTADGGTTWTDLNLPASNAASYVAVCPTDPNIVYVTVSGYTAGSKVYVSADGGTTWTNYSTGLPNLPANCITYQKNSNGAVYMGMDVGIYYRDSTTTSWQPYNAGLPNAVVSQIEIYYPTGMLRAATYGRGIWQAPLYVPASTPPTAVFVTGSNTPCAGSGLNFTDNSTGNPYIWNWSFPGAATTSSTMQNPAGIVYATAGSYTITLHVSNAAGTDSTTQTVTILPTPAAPVVTQTGSVLSTTATGGTYQWYLNGIAIAGATSQSYTATTIPGNYLVTITNSSGCTASSPSFAATATGIQELSATREFQISPNPNNGVFDFNLVVVQPGDYELNVYNTIGQVLVSQKISHLTSAYHQTIDLTSYGSGVYLLSVTDSHHQTVQKVVVY